MTWKTNWRFVEVIVVELHPMRHGPYRRLYITEVWVLMGPYVTFWTFLRLYIIQIGLMISQSSFRMLRDADYNVHHSNITCKNRIKGSSANRVETFSHIQKISFVTWTTLCTDFHYIQQDCILFWNVMTVQAWLAEEIEGIGYLLRVEVPSAPTLKLVQLDDLVAAVHTHEKIAWLDHPSKPHVRSGVCTQDCKVMQNLNKHLRILYANSCTSCWIFWEHEWQRMDYAYSLPVILPEINSGGFCMSTKACKKTEHSLEMTKARLDGTRLLFLW